MVTPSGPSPKINKKDGLYQFKIGELEYDTNSLETVQQESERIQKLESAIALNIQIQNDSGLSGGKSKKSSINYSSSKQQMVSFKSVNSLNV